MEPKEVLAAVEVRKRFGEVDALQGVSFVLRGPQVVGILGPNGAGKTTLLEILEGLERPSEGQVRLFGEPLGRGGYPRRRVGVVLQREFVLDGITAREYAELFAAIQGAGDGASVLAEARLTPHAATPVERLSGGQAQRLFIAAASVHRPELLFLDEPTAPLDPASKRELGAWIRTMGRERTVVLTTHDLREAEDVCDQVMFLVGGQVKALGAPAALIEAVPEGGRRTGRLEDAFFHFCSGRLTAAGGLEDG